MITDGDITIDYVTKTIKVNESFNGNGLTLDELYDYLKEEWEKDFKPFRFGVDGTETNLYTEIISLNNAVKGIIIKL